MNSSLHEVDLRFEGMIVQADYHDESIQPWSGKPCYRYRVAISARGADRIDYAYGSQADYEAGDHGHAEEMTWMLLHDYLNAYDDPDEFWQLAIGEPDAVGYEQARGIIELIDFADKIGELLEANRDEIETKYDEF